jgi:hypothetical protein
VATCLHTQHQDRIAFDFANRHAGRPRRLTIPASMIFLSLLVARCTTAPLDTAGSLQSYADLEPSNGLFTRSLLSVSKDDVLAAKTVRIIPTAFSAPAVGGELTAAQRGLVANAVDRTMCAGLSERFEVVDPSQPADLTVYAVITHVTPTNPFAVGLSKAASVAVSVALPGVPVPVPRIPIGLGSLSLEAEAFDQQGNQKAAMVWARGANAFFDSGQVAPEGDAYSLAAKFGGDFSKMLDTGKKPFGSPQSLKSLGNLLGGKPKYEACKAFGRSPGLVGLIGGSVGLPPDWTDKGARPDADLQKHN